MFSVAFSRRLAVLAGLLLPVLETARRWRELPGPIETWPPWLDDYFLGALLLIGAWLSRPRATMRDQASSTRMPRIRRVSWLTAAWGFVCGAGFGSTLSQLNYVINPALTHYQDPSGLAHEWVVLLKATLLAIGFVGLFSSMREEQHEDIAGVMPVPE